MEEKRICSCCGRELTADNFSGKGKGLRKMCKACANIYDAEKKMSNATPEKQLILKTLIGMAEEKGLISAQQAYDRYIEIYPEEAKNFTRPGEEDEVERVETPAKEEAKEAEYIAPDRIVKDVNGNLVTIAQEVFLASAGISRQVLKRDIVNKLVNSLDTLYNFWYEGEKKNISGWSPKLLEAMYSLLDKVYEAKGESISEFGQQITALRHANKELFDENGRLAEKIKDLQDDLKKRYKGEVKEVVKTVSDISSFTPEQLMSELYKRGYRGEIEFEVREVRKCKLGAGLH